MEKQLLKAFRIDLVKNSRILTNQIIEGANQIIVMKTGGKEKFFKTQKSEGKGSYSGRY